MNDFVHKRVQWAIQKSPYFAMLIVALFGKGPVAGAQTGGGSGSSGGGRLENPFKADSLVGALKIIVDTLVEFGVLVAGAFIVWSGFLFVSARGSEEKVNQARKTFTATIIGTTIILGAWVIITVLSETISQVTP